MREKKRENRKTENGKKKRKNARLVNEVFNKSWPSIFNAIWDAHFEVLTTICSVGARNLKPPFSRLNKISATFSRIPFGVLHREQREKRERASSALLVFMALQAGISRKVLDRSLSSFGVGARSMSSWWKSVEPAPKDPILGVTEAFLADPMPSKVNVGVVSFFFLLPCSSRILPRFTV